MLMWPFTSAWVCTAPNSYVALVFTGAWTEVIGDLSVLAAVVTAARMLFCHKQGCYRLGRFRHGHYKLCHVHHPNVPSSGKVTAAHIEQVSAAGRAPRSPSPGAPVAGKPSKEGK